MTAHTVTSYDEDLKTLDSKIALMGRLVAGQLAAALSAIARPGPEQERQAMADDAVIDAMQREIEEWAVQFMVRKQPVAMDLRNIIGAVRIAGHLEHIGDLAKGIGKQVESFDEKASLSPMTKSLGAMGDVALWQLNSVLDSYQKPWRCGRHDFWQLNGVYGTYSPRDPSMRLKVWSHDEEIGRRYDSLFIELVAYMTKDRKTIAHGAHLISCAKNIECIREHCANIAKAVMYIVTGQTIGEGRPPVRGFSWKSVEKGNQSDKPLCNPTWHGAVLAGPPSKEHALD